MIVKIFPATKNSASFPAVTYNTGKIDKTKGELMKVSGFGSLQVLQQWRPEDYRNYLKAVSAINKAVKFPQFHAVISAAGRSYDKYQLTDIASNWLLAMGYSEQPYLLFSHNDTKNNHIHIVTTRVNKLGKKINSSFENIRAIRELNKILGIDQKHSAKQDLASALLYNFSTKAQFMMILENQGYALKESEGKIELIKFGQRLGQISISEVSNRAKNFNSMPGRVKQLSRIFYKYARKYNTDLIANTTVLPGSYQKKSPGFTSEFGGYLKEYHRLILIFHAKDEKHPYGYSVIDHATKTIFKGGEIMPLNDLLQIEKEGNILQENSLVELPGSRPDLDSRTNSFYKAILQAAIRNYSDLTQGLYHLGLKIWDNGGRLFLEDLSTSVTLPVSDLLDQSDLYDLYNQYYHQVHEISSLASEQYMPITAPLIASDVDDQAVYGRKRRRKQQQ